MTLLNNIVKHLIQNTCYIKNRHSSDIQFPFVESISLCHHFFCFLKRKAPPKSKESGINPSFNYMVGDLIFVYKNESYFVINHLFIQKIFIVKKLIIIDDEYFNFDKKKKKSESINGKS